MKNIYLYSLILAVVSAVPIQKTIQILPSLPIELLSSNELSNKFTNELSSELSSELLSELNSFNEDDFKKLEIIANQELELIDFIPDDIRDQIIEVLRSKALFLKVKLVNLISAIDEKIDKIEHKIAITKNPFFRAQLKIQLKAFKILRKSCYQAKDKLNKYFVSEKSQVLKALILALERFIETKFSNYVVIVRETYNIYKSFRDADHFDKIDKNRLV